MINLDLSQYTDQELSLLIKDATDLFEQRQGFSFDEKTEYGDIYRYNKKGQFHNTRGPAVILADGSVEYYVNGKCHRTDGPAVIQADGRTEYWVNGKLHRTDGPAIIYADGTLEYWVDGTFIEEEEFNQKYGKEVNI